MQDDYSAGVSQTASTKRWDLSLSDEEVQTSSGPTYYVTFARPDEGTTLALAARFTGIPGQMQVIRLYCHYLVAHMPSSALAELAGELNEYLEFYARKTAVAALPGEMIMGNPLVAQRGKEYSRPPLSVTGE